MSDVSTRLAAALADRYRIERELGAGGMATVYLAADLKHDRQVAIKVLKPDLAAVLGAERFVQEIKTTAALSHPHILPLFDSGEAGGFLYYVMPYLQGETIREKLNRETQFGIDEAVKITTEVADALDYAHQNGVIHRDIKPENILLHNGRPMVMDFGIALAVSAAAGGRMTETGLSLGTPHYMSPEQATAEKAITARSDVYSLASVCYEMLTGNPPHVGSSAQQIIMKIIAAPVDPVTRFRKSVPSNVAAALAKALEKVPADRFASAKEFAMALPDVGFTFSAAGALPSAAGSGRGRTKLTRALPWVLVGAASVAAVASWLRPTPAVGVTRSLTILWQNPMEDGSVGRRLALSPDGNTIVYVDTVGGTARLWAKERERVEAEALAGTEGALGPTFSPDGEWIAFMADGKVRRVPRRGGSSITIADSANLVDPAIAWLDDGTVLFNDGRYDLKAVSIHGGIQRTVSRMDATNGFGVIAVTPLPNSRGALVGLCTGGCGRRDLRVLDWRTGTLQPLVEDVLKAWYLPGEIIVFVRQDGGVFAVPFDLATLSLRGSPAPVLDGVRTSLSSADMQLSPSGTLLYVARRDEGPARLSELVWVTRDGVVTPVDSTAPFAFSFEGTLALSPDGRRVALTLLSSGTDDIWVKELPQGPLTRLTFEQRNIYHTWTTDGTSILYASVREGADGTASVSQIRRKRADGSGPDVTIFEGPRTAVTLIPTADTSRFIARWSVPPRRDIHLLTLAPGDVTDKPLIGAPNMSAVQPALSADGRWLAYASDETGRLEVYVRPFPNVDDGRWQISRGGGSAPGWAHGGRELFFVDGKGAMVAVSIASDAAFAFGEPRPLFSTAGFSLHAYAKAWDVSPDNRRFVFVRPIVATTAQATGPAQVVHVDHWLTELIRTNRGQQ